MQASFDATGDVIVITGGANGIGAELARRCAQAGATVVVCDVDERAAALLLLAEPRLRFCRLDVSDRDAVMRAMQSIEAEHGRIDGLVCGAAVQPRREVHATEPQAWQKALAINLDGVVWCYQAVVPGMIRRRRGSVVAFSSGLAHSGWPQAAAYASSKAALGAFVKSAAKEVAQHRVRVNLIAPGVIDTAQYRNANAGNDDAHWANTLGVGHAEDVVGPLMFLLSDAATMTASLLSRDHAYPASEPATEPPCANRDTP
ncbi:SDR family oxidoreductase [Cupriavidus taiwanensis]|uniref:SDR family NAD(P)-dependent oxidoreductase n=1 Tax=Cupriavidus taiwanensis TaxID=164546 RepID=UPI00253FE1FD|nr:SDR family oxidoreductase [Cupriavidus taiwanensis]MDK3025975.1 SDR family oxidoreductase [Cupriavidus taiwanensis]